MESRLILPCTGGRYPAARHDRAAVVAELQLRDGTVILRIDDDNHPARWEEFACSVEELADFLRRASGEPE